MIVGRGWFTGLVIDEWSMDRRRAFERWASKGVMSATCMELLEFVAWQFQVDKQK